MRAGQITWSQMAKAEHKRNRRQRVFRWLGSICGAVGAILMIQDVVWRWIFTIRGERHIGSVPFILFCAGVLVFSLGVCLIKIAATKNAQATDATV